MKHKKRRYEYAAQRFDASTMSTWNGAGAENEREYHQRKMNVSHKTCSNPWGKLAVKAARNNFMTLLLFSCWNNHLFSTGFIFFRTQRLQIYIIAHYFGCFFITIVSVAISQLWNFWSEMLMSPMKCWSMATQIRVDLFTFLATNWTNGFSRAFGFSHHGHHIFIELITIYFLFLLGLKRALCLHQYQILIDGMKWNLLISIRRI